MKRRDLLKLALSGLAGPAAAGLASYVPGAAAQTAGPATATPAPAGAITADMFTATTVADQARTLAAQAFKAAPANPLGTIANATAEDAAAIRYKPNEYFWAGDNLAFAIEPLHRSRAMPGMVELFMVEGNRATRVVYDPARFDFGKLKPPAGSDQIGFTGFRVLNRNRDGTLSAVASLRNASFLSAIARDQAWGPITRPLTVRSPDQKGEEAPHIKSVWIEKPGPTATALVMHALVDTPSLAGAYRFTLRTDDATVIDTECTIFARKTVEHFGLAPLQASYLAGPLDRRSSDDLRPAVYEIGGLQILSGKGEWIWRPVTNRSQLQISAFVDRDPQGFGLIQRDRQFSTFLDDENQWQDRPSVWIEPIGKWGAGETTLLEVPAASHNNKNIACYWRPSAGLNAGSETHFAYRQYWSWQPPEQPDGAKVMLTRSGRTPGSTTDTKRRFLVEFSGEQLADPAVAATLVPRLWTSSGKISSVRLYRTAKQANMRVVFDLNPGSRPLIELRLVLEHGGAAMSETWLYRWTP